MYKTKKHTFILIFSCCFLSIISCDSTENDNENEWECGTYNGNTLYTGPEGGCYYKNSNNNKTYVDRSECNC